MNPVLRIRQTRVSGSQQHDIELRLERPESAPQSATTRIEYSMTKADQARLRWYLEASAFPVIDKKTKKPRKPPYKEADVRELMRQHGERLYQAIFDAPGTRALWYAIRNDLSSLRIEITAEIDTAASIPWELIRDPELGPLSARAKSFVRAQTNVAVNFLAPKRTSKGRVRVLYVVARPQGVKDVDLRAVAHRVVQVLDADRGSFHFTLLRPPTFERLQKVLQEASHAGKPFHIVHFDGHGNYVDLAGTVQEGWAVNPGPQGYVVFEHAGPNGERYVSGQQLGQVLRDNGVPVLIVNACRSAMHEAWSYQDAEKAGEQANDVHSEIRAIGSFSQAVVDQGIPLVLGMRYSVYVITAAQYIGELYSKLVAGNTFGEASTMARHDLAFNPDRWLELRDEAIQDWMVPVAYEMLNEPIVRPGEKISSFAIEQDPYQRNPELLSLVPPHGFIGRDENILQLDRRFDEGKVVLLHGKAGYGKTATSLEFARWYSITDGLGADPVVFVTTFDKSITIDRLIGDLRTALSRQFPEEAAAWGTLSADECSLRMRKVARQQGVLWIWDGVEKAERLPEATRRPIKDFLQQVDLDQASQMKVLLTSRTDLQGWFAAIPRRIDLLVMLSDEIKILARKLLERHGVPR